MRRWIILAAVLAQLGVLAFMAGQREWVVRTGEPVLVRTAPIDPSDPMRGEYARLTYEISTVPKALCRDGVAAWFSDGLVYSREFRDRRVYAVLERDESGVASLVALTDQEPADGIYLRGRTDWISASAVRVRYGIEALFMEEGRALEFENKARYERVGVPVNAEVAVGSGGLGVLRGYHWEPLGIDLRVLRREVAGTDGGEEGQGGRARQSGIVGAVVTLKNHGTEPVAVVDLPAGRSFRLMVAEERNDGTYVPAQVARAAVAPRARDVIVLQPGESHETTIDLTRPEWFVENTRTADGGIAQEPVSLESLRESWGSWYRIEYVPPSRAACADLLHAELIRHARLRSRMFSPSGGID